MGSTKTRAVTRDKLARFLENHELRKLFENLIADVTETLPTSTEDVETTAENARSLAVLARALAEAALQLANQANEGPPVLPPIASADAAPPVLPFIQLADDQPPAAVVVMPYEPEDVTHFVMALLARLAVLESAVTELREGPAP